MVKIFSLYINSFKGFTQTFWLLMLAVFINRFGDFLVRPFLSLYITGDLGGSVSQAGLILSAFTLFGIVSIPFSAYIADNLGYKNTITISMSLAGIVIGTITFINDMYLVISLLMIFSMLIAPYNAISKAITIDLVEESRKQEAFAINRTMTNIAGSITPLIAGYLLAVNSSAIFAINSITLVIFAVIVMFFLKLPNKSHQINKIRKVKKKIRLGDHKALIYFVMVYSLVTTVLAQYTFGLPIYLRDELDMYSLYFMLVAISAILVILTEVPFVNIIKHLNNYILLSISAVLIGLGFFIFIFVDSYAMGIVAIVIITIGEMIFASFGATYVSNIASLENRATYMGYYTISWQTGLAIGPLIASFTMSINPDLIWYTSLALCLVASLGFLMLYKKNSKEVGKE